MRVGFDHDGVLSNFSEGVLEAMKARGIEHLWKSGPTPTPFWDWYKDWGWEFEQFKELVDWGVDEGYVFSGQWRPNAIDTLKRVRDLGHEVVIITDRFFGTDPDNSKRNTEKAFVDAGFIPDEINYTPYKTEVYVDTMVEDKLANYDSLVVSGCPTWLINRAWNQVDGPDGRNRIDDVSQYGDAIERLSRRL